jgi:hypothetical protein
VVAVGVIVGEAAEFVPGEFRSLLVVGGDLVCGGARGQGAQVQQFFRGGGAVEAAVGDDCPGVGALGAAVVRVQVLHELGAGGAEGEGPGGRVAVGVAGVGEDVTERDAVCGHAGQHGDQGADRVGVAGGQGHPPGQPWHLRAGFLAGHGGS